MEFRNSFLSWNNTYFLMKKSKTQRNLNVLCISYVKSMVQIVTELLPLRRVKNRVLIYLMNIQPIIQHMYYFQGFVPWLKTIKVKQVPYIDPYRCQNYNTLHQRIVFTIWKVNLLFATMKISSKCYKLFRNNCICKKKQEKWIRAFLGV